jgi:glycerol-3-phosphate dehydrogenase
MESPAGSGDHYDVCIIGGGINGAGIARDAAGRGFNVLLVEQGDLGQATSSASTKLIHGGLRYLEYYEFKLVRESLKEREVLLGLAPHLIHPLRFVLPLVDDIRPTWLIRAGLFLYDRLGGKSTLPRSRPVVFKNSPLGQPLQERFLRGFSYSDCWVDDARLVVINAISAQQKGATIATRTRCSGLHPSRAGWQVELTDTRTGAVRKVSAKLAVNAAGPWVRSFINEQELAEASMPSIRLVQGSHIIVPRLYEAPHAYILQQPDGRIVFTIPYEKKFTLVGTTETAYSGDPLRAQITKQETSYLLDIVNQTFNRQILISDIVRTYSGVRPLFDDHQQEAKAVTRDYRIHESVHASCPLLSVFGGKLTTYRKLAEQTTDKISTLLNADKSAWTAREPLPGGDLGGVSFEEFLQKKRVEWPAIEPDLLERYARLYGTGLDEILFAEAGRDFGEGICEAEIRYLMEKEFAQTAEDILWRRTKLGLTLSKDVIARITNFIEGISDYDSQHTSRD